MKKLVLVIVCVLFVVSGIYGADYITSKKCKMCHKGKKKGEVFEKWQKGPHIGALETLKAKGEDKNPKCLGCHTTGYDGKAFKEEGVGCEACHGAGSDYKKMSVMKDKKKSIEMGMVVPGEAVCKECHNEKSPNFKGFDFAKYSEKMNHKFR
ncbi:MAG: cytochrome C554 [bacterium]|nr:cytochrome C554 [bacterium]